METDLNITRIDKTYAFFSEVAHQIYKGSTTVEGIYEESTPPGQLGDPEDIHLVRANWIGPSIGGYPGWIERGHLLRPAHFASYKLLAEVDPIEDQPSFTEGRITFWKAPKASPDTVFTRDAAEARRISLIAAQARALATERPLEPQRQDRQKSTPAAIIREDVRPSSPYRNASLRWTPLRRVSSSPPVPKLT